MMSNLVFACDLAYPNPYSSRLHAIPGNIINLVWLVQWHSTGDNIILSPLLNIRNRELTHLLCNWVAAVTWVEPSSTDATLPKFSSGHNTLCKPFTKAAYMHSCRCSATYIVTTSGHATPRPACACHTI